MSNYEAGKRISVKVKIVSEHNWVHCFGFTTEEMTLYKMLDDEENVLVWKTSGTMKYEDGSKYGFYYPKKGDVIEIKATVKGSGEYKGEKQTEIQRVKVTNIVSKSKTKEEMLAEKAEEQIKSLHDGDYIWRMPYKQYKEHYADCETIAGSFVVERYGASTIEVIIRDGRLKASGVRGEHYSGYRLVNLDTGEHVTYRAVKEENAIKRAVKEYGGRWECDKVYFYDREIYW